MTCPYHPYQGKKNFMPVARSYQTCLQHSILRLDLTYESRDVIARTRGYKRTEYGAAVPPSPSLHSESGRPKPEEGLGSPSWGWDMGSTISIQPGGGNRTGMPYAGIKARTTRTRRHHHGHCWPGTSMWKFAPSNEQALVLRETSGKACAASCHLMAAWGRAFWDSVG